MWSPRWPKCTCFWAKQNWNPNYLFFFFFSCCVVHKLSLTEIMLRSGMRTNLLLSYVGGKKILEELPYWIKSSLAGCVVLEGRHSVYRSLQTCSKERNSRGYFELKGSLTEHNRFNCCQESVHLPRVGPVAFLAPGISMCRTTHHQISTGIPSFQWLKNDEQESSQLFLNINLSFPLK